MCSLGCYVQRQRDWRPSTPACPGCWAMGTNKVKKCTVRKILFCTGLIRAAKADKKLLYRHDKSEKTYQGRTPFVLLESPFTWVSTVRRGRTSSLVISGYGMQKYAAWNTAVDNLAVHVLYSGSHDGPAEWLCVFSACFVFRFTWRACRMTLCILWPFLPHQSPGINQV